MATHAHSTPASAARRRLAPAPFTIHPTSLQRCRAYVATGSLPPFLVGGYAAAVALAGFGLGMILAGGLL